MQIILITIQRVFFKGGYSLEYFKEHEKKNLFQSLKFP